MVFLYKNYTQKMIWLNQENFGWFNHRIYLLYGQQNVLLTQQNIWLTRPFLVVLTKSEYLVDSTKKFTSMNQNLFGLTKFSWISNKKVLLVQELFFSACGKCKYLSHSDYKKAILSN